MTDGLGKAMADWSRVRSAEEKTSGWTWSETDYLPMPEVESEEVADTASGLRECESDKIPAKEPRNRLGCGRMVPKLERVITWL